EDQIEYKLGRLRPPLRMPSHPLGMSSSTSTKQTARGPNKPAPGNVEFHLYQPHPANHQQARPRESPVAPRRNGPPKAPHNPTPGMSSTTSTKQAAQSTNKPDPGSVEFHLDTMCQLLPQLAKMELGPPKSSRLSQPSAYLGSIASHPSLISSSNCCTSSSDR